jgi:hypothetical protein
VIGGTKSDFTEAVHAEPVEYLSVFLFSFQCSAVQSCLLHHCFPVVVLHAVDDDKVK